MYISALKRTVNWVTLVSLLVEYLLYSVHKLKKSVLMILSRTILSFPVIVINIIERLQIHTQNDELCRKPNSVIFKIARHYVVKVPIGLLVVRYRIWKEWYYTYNTLKTTSGLVKLGLRSDNKTTIRLQIQCSWQ